MNLTKLWVGHFTTVSGHFFANYINSFQKTEVQTIILMLLICINLSWIKSYGMNQIFCFIFHKWPFYEYVWPFVWQLHCTKIFHKTEVQTVILRCLVYLYLNWIKSYDIILVKNIFFMSENALFQGYFAEVSFGTSYGN